MIGIMLYLLIKTKRIDSMKRAIALCLCLTLLAICFTGCVGSGREYLDEIHIPLEAKQAEIIVREWKFLMGSGAEIYYKDDDREVMLGQIQGGDDGFCPFEQGLYAVRVEDDELVIEVGRKMDAPDIIWSTESFALPTN